MAPRSKIAKLPPGIKAWLHAALADNACSDYQWLSDELKAKGFDISRSAVHRYGQEFEDKLMAIKIATEQAKAITEAAPDDAGAMNSALISLVQQKAFKVLVDMQEGASIKDIGLMVARLSNATVKQKQFAAEVHEKLERAKLAAANEAEAIAIKSGMSDDDWALIRAKFLGIEVA
jgi:hypothetical protein